MTSRSMSTRKELTDGDFNEYDKQVVPIEPPLPFENSVKEPMKLIYEVVYLFLMLIPMTVWSILEHIFARSKPIREKVVLVTGSGRGLGRGFVEEFVRLGCKVACVDIDEKLNQNTVKKINSKYPNSAKAYKCNVGVIKQVKELKEAVTRDFGHVDILLHNAGIVCSGVITDMDHITLLGMFTTNLISHALMMREFLPDMIERNEGHYVAIGSAGSFLGSSNASIYAATKHGLLGLMESIHYELNANPKNAVKTTLICPYFVNTSALYTRFWNLRIPELSIKTVVIASINGIRKNRRIVVIPPQLYYISMILKLLPDRVCNMVREIFYVKILPISQDVIQRTPLNYYLTKTITDYELLETTGL